jgi:hypothetical protein
MTNAHINTTLAELESQFLDQVDIRNNTKPHLVKHTRAKQKADDIERQASLLVFGDSDHTLSECIEEMSTRLA